MNMVADTSFDPQAPITLAELRAELMPLYEPPMRAPTTRAKMVYAFKLLEAIAGPGATTADISPGLIARFVASRSDDEAPRTTTGLLHDIRVIANYAEARGYLHRNPFALRRRWVSRSAIPERPRHHSIGEIRDIFTLLRADVAGRTGWGQWRARRLLALFGLVAYTGLRRNEALYLQVTDIDLPARMIFLRPNAHRPQFKTAKSAQPVPIAEPLAELLSDWLSHRLVIPGVSPDVPPECAIRAPMDCPWLIPNVTFGNPWTGGSAGCKPVDRLRAAGMRAGVEGVCFLSLRHSFATHAESAWGLTAVQIQRVLRHTTTRTQEFYRHADIDNLRGMVRRVRFDRTEGTD